MGEIFAPVNLREKRKLESRNKLPDDNFWSKKWRDDSRWGWGGSHKFLSSAELVNVKASLWGFALEREREREKSHNNNSRMSLKFLWESFFLTSLGAFFDRICRRQKVSLKGVRNEWPRNRGLKRGRNSLTRDENELFSYSTVNTWSHLLIHPLSPWVSIRTFPAELSSILWGTDWLTGTRRSRLRKVRIIVYRSSSFSRRRLSSLNFIVSRRSCFLTRNHLSIRAEEETTDRKGGAGKIGLPWLFFTGKEHNIKHRKDTRTYINDIRALLSNVPIQKHYWYLAIILLRWWKNQW